MGLPRSAVLRTAIRSSPRRPNLRSASRPVWRQPSRRAYSSGHQQHTSGSDLPWAIGSAVVFFPAAAWLWQQGPEKSTHGHGEEHHEGGEEEHEESGEDEQKDRSDQGGEDEAKEDGAVVQSDDDNKDGSETDSQGDSSSDDESTGPPTPVSNDPEDSPEASDDKGSSKGIPQVIAPDEQQPSDEVGQSGKPKSKLDKRRQNTSSVSAAYHPAFADPEKSEKSEGVKDTAKITGTVDPYRKPSWKQESPTTDK